MLAVGVCLLVLAAAAVPQVRSWYHWRAGRAAMHLHQTADARVHLEAYLHARPGNAEAQLLAARAARWDGDFEAAQGHLRECQRLLQGTSAETTLEWALLRASGGDLDEVEGYLQEQSRKDANQVPVVMEALAVGYLRLFRLRDALACLEGWLSREPDCVRALALRGQVWRQVQAWAKAVQDYRRIGELDLANDDALWWLGVSLQELGRNDEALPHLERLRPQRRGDPELLVRIARCYKAQLRMDEARELLDAVIAQHPDHALALRIRGEVEYTDRNMLAAEHWLGRAIRVAPNDYRAHYTLAQCLQSQPGRQADAKAQLGRAETLKERLERLTDITNQQMSVRPHDPALHAELGALLLELGDKDSGRRWLFSALRLDPACKASHAALAVSYSQDGDAERADYHRRASVNAAASTASGSSRP
jgi:tetratricopeptide (TPR) repeat protein